MIIPSSTYRIQLNDHFTLRDLQSILPYLHALGISTIYASPLTTAAKASQHGYDVTDPLLLNPEIGTEQQWQQLTAILRNYRMTWIQDIVPNHMAYNPANPWLFDLLQRGKDSLYHTWFDIITDHPVELLGDKLMAPFLGNTLTECLQKNELCLQFTHLGFVIRYYETEYPVAIRLYRWILTIAAGCPPGLLTSLDELEQALTAGPVTWRTAMENWLARVNPDAGYLGFISARVVFFNQRIHLLESLLQNQPYVLTLARLAASHINYRRFFAVNSLICLSMEKEAVFNAWHQTLRRWQGKGLIDGLRIDHIDGLADPKKYLQRLRELFGKDCYIIVEKILGQEETLPADWPVEGTTGYDFLAAAGQVLCDAEGGRQLRDFYLEKVAGLPPFETLVYERKKDFLTRQMGGEWDNLLDLLTSLPLLQAAGQEKSRLKQALAVWMCSFPTYRAYPDEEGISPSDRRIFSLSLSRAKERQPDFLPELNYLSTLCDDAEDGSADQRSARETRHQRLSFLRRLMQFTGPLAAKGIEDTSYYVYNPYIGHCEVGDTPAIAGIGVMEFHRRMQQRQATQHYALNATSTHDTKRGEDARIRLNFLSAIPREWTTAVSRWWQLNCPHILEVNGRRAPSPNDEYLVYQALLGSWPEDGIVTDAFRQRFAAYLTKALREAKTETGYDDPDQAYEQQCQAFTTAILRHDSAFLEAFVPFAGTVIRRSSVYSLSQLLLKTTAPGIPDIYQGAEAWETSLVDPDNRRPVDFALRTTLLAEIKAAEAVSASAVLDYARSQWQKGAEKLFTLYRILACRNRLPLVFAEGDYIPLNTEGPLLSYIRRHGDDWALIAVPLIRYETAFPAPVCLSLPGGAPADWTDIFTGRNFSGPTLTWKDGLSEWPVALLTGR